MFLMNAVCMPVSIFRIGSLGGSAAPAIPEKTIPTTSVQNNRFIIASISRVVRVFRPANSGPEGPHYIFIQNSEAKATHYI